MSGESLISMGERVVALARRLGADEVTARVSRSASTELTQRDGQLEKCQESRSLSVRASLLVDGRFSGHGTSDLRPEALESFLKQAIDATRYLEPDPHRGLPELAQMGITEAELDQVDTSWFDRDPQERRAHVERLEKTVSAHPTRVPLRSATAYVWDGHGEAAMVCSNGFSVQESNTSFGHGAMMTLEDKGGRLPEGYAFYSSRHADTLPAIDDIATELVSRAEARVGSGPAPSGRYPLLLENRVVGRLLRILLGPMGGTSVYEGRSCLKDRLGTRIASPALSIWDDPLIPRGLGSQVTDNDGLPAMRRPLLEEGVLSRFLVGVYNGRRLKVAPTTASTSNIIIEPGTRSLSDISEGLERAVLVQGFLGGNTNPTTGDFSFGIHGKLLERGEPVASLSEMNVAGNLFSLLERYTEAADDVWLHGSWRTPTLLFDDIQFSGS